MNRYQSTFAHLRARNETGFMPFAIAGDPDIDRSEAVFSALLQGGADVLEIGYPFSDPVADGPINQRAAIRAIRSGLNHASFFALIKRLRAKTDIPFGVLLYANTVHHLGYETFCRKAAQAGIDSLLVADMPPEESHDLAESMRAHHLGRVFIVSELTPDKRMRFICDQVDAFVYVVSRLGTTGVGKDLDSTVCHTIRRLRSVTDKPLAVGFGISTPQHVSAVRAAGADAAIVGSALVSLIEKDGSRPETLCRALKRKVAEYKAATRGSSQHHE